MVSTDLDRRLHLQSERVIVAAPMSYTGSAQRIWKMLGTPVLKWTLGLCLVAAAWAAITVWYLIFGLFLVPFRLIRRGQRKQKQADLRHRELLHSVSDRERKAS